MKSLFETDAHQEILNRINNLTDKTEPQWGIMNVGQMLKHCQGPLEVSMGKKELHANLGFMKKMIFKLFKSSLYNDRLYKPGIPTAPEYVVRTEHDFNTEKTNLKTVIDEFNSLKNKTDWTEHPLFGNFTPEQWGKAQYKHLDHHLRQFGV
ncbi:DUF1569 domain-containing protein [Seonamhaeicola sp.]|uniref:DUF1569 domain-containing protein n=1 Tax=Seonamhaeicola sp. TaxID=1912245 RepID=UPI00261F24C8|nr:DUF1569 domain-containing protein [Seonamhaeicola sp.]